jgi:outer membrane protein W
MNLGLTVPHTEDRKQALKRRTKMMGGLKKHGKWYLPVILGAFLVMPTMRVLAQDVVDITIEDNDVLIAPDQIDVDGDHNKISDSMKKSRDAIEKQNEERVRQNIEKARRNEEMKLNKKLEGMFSGKVLDTDEDAPAVVAAPVAPEAVVIVEAMVEPIPTTRLTPSIGVTNISGEGNVDYNTNVRFGLAFDKFLASNFAIGLGVNYSTMSITQSQGGLYGNMNPYYQGYQGYYGNQYPQFGNWYNPYTSVYGMGRTVNYRNAGVEVTGKIYLSTETIVRPYLGAGIGGNRVTLRFDGDDTQSNSFNLGPFAYGNEYYSNIYASGTAMLGSDLALSSRLGVNAELRYSKALAGGSTQDSGYTVNPDQMFLNALGDGLNKADNFTISIGLNAMF